MKKELPQACRFMVIDTDSHNPVLFGLENPKTHQLIRAVLQIGKGITVAHKKPPLYTSERDIRQDFFDDESFGRHDQPITQFYVHEVHGTFMGPFAYSDGTGGGMVTDAKIQISLTGEKDAPQYQLNRDKYWLVVYPKDKVKIE